MRVAIVNDSQMTKEMLRRTLSEAPGCELAWTAADGEEAVRKCKADKPELILMDLVMPVMDGVEATRRIMKEAPCQILIVTSSVDRNSGKVFEALGSGALDAVKTPALGSDGRLKGDCELLKKISSLKKLSSHDKPAAERQRRLADERLPERRARGNAPLLVAIGSSTGGPSALLELLAQIPGDINAAFVVIQHLDKQFAQGLASWLASLCSLKIMLAKEGAAPEKGAVMIAETNDHLILTQEQRFHYTQAPEDNPYRPSVDVFFSSLAANSSEKGAAVLLTGIGRDGANGLLSLKKAGWMTFAQDKGSCVVYGMPKAAAELDAACEILTPAEAGRRIMKIISLHQREAL